MSGLANQDVMAKRKGPRCGVTDLLNDMDDEDAATFQGWLDDPQVGHQVIADAVRAHTEAVLGSNTVGRHRRGQCVCGR